MPYIYVHLLISILLGFPILNKFGKPYFLIFIIANLIPDLDHIISFLVNRDEYHETFFRKLFQEGLKSAVQYMDVVHKKISHLYLHNVIFYAFLLITITYLIFFTNTLSSNTGLLIFLLGVLLHLTLDIFDDIYVLGSAPNWFWVFGSLNPFTILLGSYVISITGILIFLIGYYLAIKG